MEKTADPIAEYIVEEGWRKSCTFMREIEDECETKGRIPVNILLVSDNLKIKWLQYALRN